MEKCDIQRYRRELLEKLPTIVTRKQALETVGNLYSPRTLTNLESKNEGPRNKMKIGRQVAYYREDFVEFIINRLQIL